MIVIPMVGRSRRFSEAGYSQPKYKLDLWGRSVFSHAVGSFSNVFNSEEVLIVSLAQDDVGDFVTMEMRRLRVPFWRLVELPTMTLGQADTVRQGLLAAGGVSSQGLTIFNIDTFRPNFSYPQKFSKECVDGYLECFIGSGANWSNVVPIPSGNNQVLRTSEKKQESNYCCTGLYYFRESAVFMDAITEALVGCGGSIDDGEFYIAPLYNSLIRRKLDIRYDLIERSQIAFCGVPNEYEDLRRSRVD